MFTHDDRTRFDLALACGNIDVAMNTAYDISDKECWTKLGLEALRQGKQEVISVGWKFLMVPRL